MDDIRDVRPPIETPLWVWILIALAVCAIIVAIYFALRRRKAGASSAPVIVRHPWEIAFERLDQLTAKKYPEQGQFKLFYSELSDIVRHYLEDRFKINAPEMTTEEFLNFVKTTGALTDDHKVALKDFLNMSDMVKFAKHEPTINDAQAGFDLAKKLVTSTLDGI